LVDIPLVVKRALAEGNIGKNGKKLLFIFLRGANDGLNSLVPILDPAYGPSRPNIAIPADGAVDYSATGPCVFPQSGINPTYGYGQALKVGNGFAALHPALKFLSPLYNAGDLALIHRVGYPKQSRSHFDSQNYWENGNPNNKLSKDGILYRTMVESGLASTSPLTGVSVQSSLPLILRGSKAAMTNLTDPLRYDLLGVPNDASGNFKADEALKAANGFPFADKKSREFLKLQYQNLTDTLKLFADLDFTDEGNTFVDDVNTDGDYPYHLFPTSNQKNGGYVRSPNVNAANKYVVETNAYGFFTNLKAASLILNNTDAIVAGTEMGGFDTHGNQGAATGAHANLQKRIGWAMYALQKYFTKYAKNVNWDNLVVVTLSEFGRTTEENSDAGTDHAEAGLMFVGGGAVKGGVYNCGPNDTVPWVTGQTGSMFGTNGRYLKRSTDFRSVLGEIIREHLGATETQLNRIIPGYGTAGENLLAGGVSSIDNTAITGELDII
jgi:uncharacterized protein (DUF1501 family)